MCFDDVRHALATHARVLPSSSPTCILVPGDVKELLNNNKLLAGNSVQCIFGDAPYEVGKRKDTFDKKLTDDEWRAIFKQFRRVLQPGGRIVLFCNQELMGQLVVLLKTELLMPDETYYTHTWEKNNKQPGAGFVTKHEPLDDVEYALVVRPREGGTWHYAKGDNHRKALGRFDVPPRASLGMKPLKMLMAILEHMTNPGDVVLDCFMFRGQVGEAALKLNRRYIGCEIVDGAFAKKHGLSENIFEYAVNRLKSVLVEKGVDVTEVDVGAGDMPPLTGDRPPPLPAVSPVLENAPLSGGDGSSPPGSHIGETLGGGGCVAVALCRLGVIESVKVAKERLNAQMELFAAKSRPDQRVSEFVGVPDDHWHKEIVKMAVLDAGYHFKKLDLKTVDLAKELKSGLYLIDGVLNDSFVERLKGKEVRYDTDPADESNPRENEAEWRHAIAVKDGRVLEKGFDMSSDWLWLKRSTPDPKRGYMLKVLVAYRITACTGDGCSGCSAKRQRR